MDYRGKDIGGPAPEYGEAIVSAPVDIEALRRFRAAGSRLAHLRADVYAEEYARAISYPRDAYLEKPIQSRTEGPTIVKSVVEEYYKKGVWKRPEE
jgi:hypothetical protein